MTYSFHEHTADIRMDVESESFSALFHQALLGMFEFLRPVLLPQRVERAIGVRSSDTTALLVDFLNEALSSAQANKEAYESIQFAMLRPTELRATLLGWRISSFGEDIKAVTYHEATVEQLPNNAWRAHVVFDI